MNRKPLIGVMFGWKVEPEVATACAVAAAHYGADLFQFRTSDIGEDSIIGMQLEGDRWIKKRFPYPDVVYDKTRRKGVGKFDEAYRKLEGVPISHTLRGFSMNKSKVYNLIRENKELKPYLIPFLTLKDADRALAFVEKHRRVIFKPNGSAQGSKTMTLEQKGDVFELFDQEYLHRFSREQIQGILEMLVTKKYFAQKLIESVTPQGHPFHVRAHLSKNGENRWIVSYHSIGLSLTPHVRISNTPLTYRATSTWEDFLINQFNEKADGPTAARIDAFALKTVEYLEQAIDGQFHEVGLDMGIDPDGGIWIFEAGIGNTGTSYYQMQAALPAIAYVLYLLRQSRQDLHLSV
ncbi:hypothetical protein CDO73_12270 [Saccharibacillus sp. O23]|uniref:YheC/YheD family protein n=1 Tax=Saccharibacillus sp. O23 TaxID=2009338 RepID=UPI000B4E5C40|nr:YheC/YheD family protein [Saccharibacillus sp. O23]OWR29855.1 hypothetical protein CDO73_12270 [Saccharibacillus sp. O23]